MKHSQSVVSVLLNINQQRWRKYLNQIPSPQIYERNRDCSNKLHHSKTSSQNMNCGVWDLKHDSDTLQLHHLMGWIQINDFIIWCIYCSVFITNMMVWQLCFFPLIVVKPTPVPTLPPTPTPPPTIPPAWAGKHVKEQLSLLKLTCMFSSFWSVFLVHERVDGQQQVQQVQQV